MNKKVCKNISCPLFQETNSLSEKITDNMSLVTADEKVIRKELPAVDCHTAPYHQIPFLREMHEGAVNNQVSSKKE